MATKKATTAPAKKAAPKAAEKKAAPAKKAPEKKAAEKKAPAKKQTPVTDRFTKTQIVDQLAEDTGLTKKDVNAVLDSLTDVIERHIKKKAVGEFVLPGMLKIKTVEKPARKARKGINPFTGQETTFAARPKSTSVKVTALKKMKDMAN